MELNDTQFTIVRYMFFDTRIGHRHCGLREIQRGFPTHQRGEVEGALKKLIKMGLVIFHPTNYGKQYSLNPKMINEIREIVNPNDRI